MLVKSQSDAPHVKYQYRCLFYPVSLGWLAAALQKWGALRRIYLRAENSMCEGTEGQVLSSNLSARIQVVVLSWPQLASGLVVTCPQESIHSVTGRDRRGLWLRPASARPKEHSWAARAWRSVGLSALHSVRKWRDVPHVHQPAPEVGSPLSSGFTGCVYVCTTLE